MVKAADAVCNGDKACEQQFIKEGIDAYNEKILKYGKYQIVILGALIVAPKVIAVAEAGMAACSLNPVLCANQVAKELSALMAMEKSGELTPGLAKKLKEFLNKTPETNIVTKGSSAKSAEKGSGVKINTEQADNVIIKPSTNATETLPTVD